MGELSGQAREATGAEPNPMPADLTQGTLREVIEGGYWYLPPEISAAVLKALDEAGSERVSLDPRDARFLKIAARRGIAHTPTDSPDAWPMEAAYDALSTALARLGSGGGVPDGEGDT